MKLALARVAEFVSGRASACSAESVAQGYSIDSRTIQPGELFFAVKGERLDGHDYVAQALDRGAVAAVVRKDQHSRYPAEAALLAVDDTLIALQTLAACVRRLWGKPVIGVTGSAGKTTTKEAIAHLLGHRHRVLKSEGNFNNHFGMPLMVLKLEPEHEMAVIEMGMSHLGEIAALAKIAQPSTGVVTGVAPVHLESFASIADIARAKYELIASLPSGGTAVLNADDEYVSQFGRDFRGHVVTFGLKPTADVSAANIQSRGLLGSTFDLLAYGLTQTIELPLLGMHNVYNALAATAVALEIGVSPSEVAIALSTLQPASKRGQIIDLRGVTVINDCYNSNPKALNFMVDALLSLSAQRRIVVAGEMLELGSKAEQMHRECGQHMAEKKIDQLVGVRGLAQAMVDEARKAGVAAEFVATPEEAGAWLARETKPGDAVLLKASRGVKLERALETWQATGPERLATGN
jgi:UDP-N-acetylmuramoyl-tripeptide--D-alanyl-D-alanine ligase